MDYADFVDLTATHSAAVRAAAVEAGPDTPVPTCPKWDVRGLVRHLARVQSWAAHAVHTADPAQPPPRPDVPESFTDVLTWWDEQLDRLLTGLRAHDPDDPAWVFGPIEPRSMRFWARRQAHEAAIHRLDAESALARPPATHFDPEFAADGVDEMLTVMAPIGPEWSTSELAGTVLHHAADAGRAWLVTFAPGRPPETSEPGHAVGGGFISDASVAGTADALFRQVWGRPSTAVASGNPELAAAIHGR